MLGVGSALGLPVAGVIAEHADYHVLFWICVAGGAITLAGTVALVPEPPVSGHGRFDLPGALLLAVALAALLLPLSQASVWGWAERQDDRPARGLGGAACRRSSLVERRRASPVVDVVVNARPALLLTNLASLAVGFALFAVLIGTANFVEAPPAAGYGFGSSILVGGLCLLPSGLFMLAAFPGLGTESPPGSAPRSPWPSARRSSRPGSWCGSSSSRTCGRSSAGTAIAGAGTGIAYAAMPSLILRSAPRDELAAANGLNSLARTAGSSLASALGGTVLTSQTDHAGGVRVPVARRLPDAVRDLRRRRARRGGDRPDDPDVVRRRGRLS